MRPQRFLWRSSHFMYWNWIYKNELLSLVFVSAFIAWSWDILQRLGIGDWQGLFVKDNYWEISLPDAPISIPCPASLFRNFSWSWCNIPIWYIRILKGCYDAFINLEMTLSSLDFVEKCFCLFCCFLAWAKGDFLVTGLQDTPVKGSHLPLQGVHWVRISIYAARGDLERVLLASPWEKCSDCPVGSCDKGNKRPGN